MKFQHMFFVLSVLFSVASAPLALAADSDLAACRSADSYNEPDATVAACDRVLASPTAKNTEKAMAQLKRGESFYWVKRSELAIPALDAALKLDPDLNAAYLQRGWAYLMTNQFVAAARDFNDFLSREPDNPDGHFALGIYAFDVGRSPRNALLAYERVLKINPDDFLARFNLAMLFECADCDVKRAEAEMARILAAGRAKVGKMRYYNRKNKDDYDFYAYVLSQRARFFKKFHRYAEAMADADWLVAQYPALAESYDLRAELYSDTNNYVAALADAEAALALDRFALESQKIKLSSLWRLGRRAELLREADKLIDAGSWDQATPYVYLYRGMVHKHFGRYDKAFNDIAQAVASDDWLARSISSHMINRGFLMKDLTEPYRGPSPDTSMAEYQNGLQACVVDPECLI